jgi:hypothetical protein
VERLAARIFEHQHGAPRFVDEIDGQSGPPRVQLRFQAIFVCEAIEDGRRRAFRARGDSQHTRGLAVSANTPSPIEDAFAVTVEDFKLSVATKLR